MSPACYENKLDRVNVLAKEVEWKHATAEDGERNGGMADGGWLPSAIA